MQQISIARSGLLRQKTHIHHDSVSAGPCAYAAGRALRMGRRLEEDLTSGDPWDTAKASERVSNMIQISQIWETHQRTLRRPWKPKLAM